LSDGLQWYFELIDRVTSPARRMEQSLNAVTSAAKKADRSTNSASLLQFGTAIRTVFGSGMEGAFYKGASKLASTFERIDKVIPLDVIKTVGPSLLSAAGSVVSIAGSVVVGVAEGVAVTVGAVAVAAGTLTALGLHFAAESAEFKRNTLFGLQTMLGTAADAREVLGELESYARDTAMGKDAFVGFAHQLLGAGFQRDELKFFLGALSDIQAANGGDIAAANVLMSQLTRIKSLDKVQSRELFAFGSIGLSSDKIFAALAQQRNITLRQAKALFDSGDLNSKEALDTILTAIRTNLSGGTLGALGLKYEEGSLRAQLQHLKDAAGDLFENVNTRPLTDFLGRLNAAMAGGGTERIGAAINRAFGAFASFFDRLTGGDLLGAIDKLANAFTSLVDASLAFFEAVLRGWDSVKEPLESAVDAVVTANRGMGDTAGWAQWVSSMVEAAGRLAIFVLKLIELTERVNNAAADLSAAGAQLVAGLWQGLQTGWAEMMTKFRGLVEALPASVRKILGIASPSRVMATIGLQSAQGYLVGWDRVDIAGAMQAAMAPPMSPSLWEMATVARSKGNGGGGITVHLTINVDGSRAHDPHELAEEIKPMAVSALTTALEQLGLESGG
jgi:hypothetical protein